jgi:hypothetical protein
MSEKLLTYYLKELRNRLADLQWHGGELNTFWHFDKDTIKCLKREYNILDEHIKRRELDE